EVYGESVLNVQDHVGLDELLEARLFDFEAVRAGREIRKGGFARSVGCGFVVDVGVYVGGGDFGGGYDGFGGGGELAGKRGICGLGGKSSWKGNQEEQCECWHAAHGLTPRKA